MLRMSNILLLGMAFWRGEDLNLGIWSKSRGRQKCSDEQYSLIGNGVLEGGGKSRNLVQEPQEVEMLRMSNILL